MPTDLPPDYKPQPANDPASPADPTVPGSAPAYPPAQGEDARDPTPGKPSPDSDVVDPSGLPGALPGGVPAPAGMPTI